MPRWATGGAARLLPQRFGGTDVGPPSSPAEVEQRLRENGRLGTVGGPAVQR
ncbi:hypothetical protein [Streptomyces sp. NPDC050388]|uniref:hypothetical protein n=1 Tax=Streptomyces sp. NPDC050388 TaxID=3155781 RepID=UPI00343E4BB6